MSYSGKFKDKNNNLHPVTSVLYGTCDTAAATAEKVVTCADFDTLMTGVTIRVKFTNGNTAASPTVNINSTGAKSVYRFGSTAPVDGNSWNAGEVVELVYDGTSFFMTNADDIGAKQNATDNNLTTTDKTVVGGINELKRGLIDVNSNLTSYKTQNNINLEVPNRKNLIAMTVDGIKAANSGATWTGNTTTISGVTYTIETDDGGNVIGILANGKCTEVWHSVLYLAITDQIDSSIFLTGCPSGGNAYTFAQQIYDAINDSVITRDYGDGDNNNPILSSLSEGLYVRIVVRYDYTANNLEFKPMVRPATITDPTFAPYIPSVDARLEAVESGLTNLTNRIYQTTYTIPQNGYVDVPVEGANIYVVWRDSANYTAAGIVASSWQKVVTVLPFVQTQSTVITVADNGEDNNTARFSSSSGSAAVTLYRLDHDW